ncbi:APC family permease [Micromonospora sonneratiae]|uniref:APC family permease n=1 Tax=Micromonospora sonneratiae TaxID=1184706 RepID=A0ABW3YFG8_9ACTN
MSVPVPSDPVAATLAAGRLGVPAVVFFVMSAATPLTVVAGVVTTGYATTGLTGIPVAFLLIGVVLAVFAVGYVAMARRMANAGAFYAYIARGVGRPVGVGAAWVALVSYNALQVGLYGAIGSAIGPLIEQWLDVRVAWWLIALAGWAVTAVLGLLRVDINGTVLAVLLLAEVAVIVVYSVADLAHPAADAISTSALSPGNLVGPGVGAILALAVLGFVGFESAVVFSEESKDPQRTVPTATYIAVGGTALLYAFASWAMTVATGPDQIVARSQTDGPELIFNLAEGHLGPTVVTVGHTLFATSIVAAMISFHNTTARYMFALGRERVLPAVMARTTRRGNAPRNASLVQSGIGFAVIAVYAFGGWDPLVHLFFWGGTSGGLGVLLLITATAVAVPVFFTRHPGGENTWRRVTAPAVALLALAVVLYLAVRNFGTLLGVPPGHWLAWAVPATLVSIGVAGTGWGVVLRATRPSVYAAIGLGAKATGVGPAPARRTRVYRSVPARQEETLR